MMNIGGMGDRTGIPTADCALKMAEAGTLLLSALFTLGFFTLLLNTDQSHFELDAINMVFFLILVKNPMTYLQLQVSVVILLRTAEPLLCLQINITYSLSTN